MKKILARILVMTMLFGVMPAFADDDSSSSGSSGGGGGGGGAGAGIAIGAAVIAGLIGLIIYNVNKDKGVETPKAEDPFAPLPSETSVPPSSQTSQDTDSGGFGANKKLEF